METENNFEKYFTTNAGTPEHIKQTCVAAFENARMAAIKQKLLKEAEGKKPMFFYQITGNSSASWNLLAHVDKDDDELRGYGSWNLEYPNEVQLLIHESAKPEDVLRLLKKIRQWIKRDPDFLKDKSGRDYWSSSETDDLDIPF